MLDPYQFPVTCAVCGEEGVATIDGAASRWSGGTLRHTDPQVCANNLARRKCELDAREKTLDARVST